MNEYLILSVNEHKLREWEISLNWPEAEDLLEYRDVFVKFLKKSKLSYQIELSKWTFRGKEEQLYRSMETIDELLISIDSVEKAFKEHLTK